MVQWSLYDHVAPVYYESWNDAMSGKVSEQWYPGGRHSGKSMNIARLLVALFCSVGNERCHAVVFRKHQVDLRESVYSEIWTAIEEMGLQRLFYRDVGRLRMVRKDTGQVIFFHGLDDPQKHKSKKPPFGYVKWMWFEELDEFRSYQEIDSVSISYQRGPKDAKFLQFMSYNPPRSVANWVNAQAATHKPGRKVYNTDYRDLIEMGWISQSVLDRIEYAKSQNYENYKHIYLGIPTGTGGEIFTNIKDETITNEMIASFTSKNYGMDFGIVNDPTVLEGTYYDSDKDYIYIFDEWTKMHPYFTDVYDALVRKHLSSTDITADTAPAGWIQNINRLGAKLHGCYKAEDWIETGISWMRSRTRIVIDSERCPLAWKEFSRYEYDCYKDGTPKEKLPDRDNHAIDSVRYSLEHYIKNSARKTYVGIPVGKPRSYGTSRSLF